MANITEHLIELQKLTKQNLDILKAINDSFYTKQNHLSINVGNTQYSMPSFISLENKVNTLLANFNNLINAPETGEAYFNFDGNSRAIEVRPYTETPNSLVLKEISNFEVEQNHIFKDFTTPIPYIKMDVFNLPNDITNVVVKKIVPQSDEFKKHFEGLIGEKTSSKQYLYSDLNKILDIYTKNIDYIEYEFKLSLPIRKNIGTGTYVVEEIIEDIVNDDLENFLTLRIRTDLSDPSYMNSLKYKLFDESIEKYIKIGDELVTYEGNAKLLVTNIQYESNIIEVKVLHGEYINLIPTSKTTDPNPTNISALSKLKFYSPIDFDNDKYVKIPLEEDRYVFVAVAALNDRMNVQSPWGTGLLVDTYNLKNIDDNDLDFKSYYHNNVKNIGDILFEITSMMSNTLTDKTLDEYKRLTDLIPTIEEKNLLVVHINKHLDDSKAIQNIRSLYAQKKELQSQYEEIQNEISNIQDILTTISFDDTTGIRTTYTTQLSSLNIQRNDINSAIMKLINDISLSANNSEVPIENAKYRIRGFIDYRNIIENAFGKDSEIINHIKGIRVQYRYKNGDQVQNRALTFDAKFTFSDWNDMSCFDREKISKYENGKYEFRIADDNSNVNEPSFNQIDIPISQGETVDIRFKLVYDYGYPFVLTTSNWSQIFNIGFPDEFLKNVKILDIIEENNNDIENNRITNTLNDSGVTQHINDKITDQDITYWHKPENIASGFYTQERRIIPLKDKLFDLSNEVTYLKDEIFNLNADSLSVSIKHNNNISDLMPYQKKNIYVDGYGNIDKNNEGIYVKDTNGLVTTILNISIKNNSDHSVKLFSMFPGGRDVNINDLINYKFAKEQYQNPYNTTGSKNIQGIWFEHPEYEEQCSHNAEKVSSSIQGGNQFIYFRLTDPNTGTYYYSEGNQSGENLLSMDKNYIKAPSIEMSSTCAYLYPKLSHRFNLTIESNTIGSYLILSPQQEIIIPLVFEYFVRENESISKTISFEIFPSLYKDPIPYICCINAKYQNSLLDDITMTNQQHINNVWGDTPVKYNTVFK